MTKEFQLWPTSGPHRHQNIQLPPFFFFFKEIRDVCQSGMFNWLLKRLQHTEFTFKWRSQTSRFIKSREQLGACRTSLILKKKNQRLSCTSPHGGAVELHKLFGHVLLTLHRPLPHTHTLSPPPPPHREESCCHPADMWSLSRPFLSESSRYSLLVFYLFNSVLLPRVIKPPFYCDTEHIVWGIDLQRICGLL